MYTISVQVSHTALNTSENILMCAPTGAGKTNVAMLSILHTMSLYRDAETGKIDTSKFKIIYVAPMKVLKPLQMSSTPGCSMLCGLMAASSQAVHAVAWLPKSASNGPHSHKLAILTSVHATMQFSVSTRE